MENLMIEFKNTIKEKGFSQTGIARELGLKKAYMTKVLKLSIEPSFFNMFNIFNHVYNASFNEYLDKFATWVTSKDNVLSAFEYSSFFQRDELLHELIAVNDERGGDFAEYALIYELANCGIRGQELTIKCREMYGSLKTNEMRAKILLVEASEYYQLGKTHLMLDIASMAEKMLKLVSDSYFRKSLESRLYGIMANGVLYEHSNKELAREYAEKVVDNSNSSNSAKASALHILAHSYFFECYETSKAYLYKAASVYREFLPSMADEISLNELQFLSNLHNRGIDLESSCAEEKLHYYIRNGDRESAEVVVKNANLDLDCPYVCCYLGVLNSDFSLLLSAQAKFIDRGNKYFSKFVDDMTKIKL